MIEDFSFKGKSAKSMGVIMSDPFLFAGPSWNYEEISIEGRDGSLFVPLNIKDTTRDINCTLAKNADKDKILAWLTGVGEFVVKERKTTARIFDQIDFNRLGWDKESFTIPIIISPLWFPADENWVEVTSTRIYNNGNYKSKPIIKITFTGGAYDNRLSFDLYTGNGSQSESNYYRVTNDYDTLGFKASVLTIDTSNGDVTFNASNQSKNKYAMILDMPAETFSVNPGSYLQVLNKYKTGSDSYKIEVLHKDTYLG